MEYLNCKLKRSKSKAGAWCTVVTYANGETALFNNFAHARESLDIQAKSNKAKWKERFSK